MCVDATLAIFFTKKPPPIIGDGFSMVTERMKL
jgi:hypothetical protein